MKITKKLTLAGLGAACALTLSMGVGLLANNRSFAKADNAAEATKATAYFYDNLRDSNGKEYTLAKKFYEALDEMNQAGDFVDGVIDYPLDDIVTSDQLKSWIENGNLEVPKAFSAARDSYLTDHPELFYIDFYKITISVAKSGGNYIGFINSGKEANLYYDNGGLTSESAVKAAIKEFNGKIDAIVADANKAQAADTYSERDVFLARYVSKALGDSIKYDYDAYNMRNDPDAQKTAQAHINTAYGGLVLGTAVCGGYSTSYKVIMDKLGIPCITVNGYSKQRYNADNPESNVYHMWNYVWLENPSSATAKSVSYTAYADSADGEWYSVDCTWGKAVLNAAADAEQHVNDGRISSSNYELKYPKLSSHIYGSSGSEYGLQQSVDYEDSDTEDEDGNAVIKTNVTVSYNGKSAKRLLEEDGLHIAYRACGMIDGKLAWTQWSSLERNRQFMGLDVDDDISRWYDDGNETRFIENTLICYFQLAVFEEEPDVTALGSGIYYRYSEELVNEIKAVEMGEVIVNQTYGTYTPAPYIISSNPTHQVEQVITDSMSMGGADTGKMAEKYAQIYELTYDEPLHIIDTKKPIGIDFISDHPNARDYARFLEFESENTPGKMVTVEIVQRPKNSGDPTLVYNTIRFKFAPSLMYRHNREGYFISFTNVGSAKEVQKYVGGVLKTVTSDKAPNPAYYSFGRLYMACPACFNYDGRLWVDCCAQPTLVSNSDLSVDNFTDENGSTFSENERSQMMLVAEKADTSTVNTMLDEISGDNNINVNKNEIKKSETYDIALQICGKYPTIPKGSYVKIALGFPDGYGPDDEGVTFKLFHRKNVGGNNYIIEEVPCVVTRFGIVATVTSFSPYMVAVVDADKATDKTVFASIEGKGGKLSLDDGQVKSVKEGESCTYTIQPDTGYQIYSVLLNGEEVKEQVVSGKLTLDFDDLKSNNQLVIQYIADDAATRIQQKITNNVIDEDVAVNATNYVVSLPTSNGQSKNYTAAIVISIVCVVVLAAAVTTIVLVIRKKKH